jgi:hypothetical protein
MQLVFQHQFFLGFYLWKKLVTNLHCINDDPV